MASKITLRWFVILFAAAAFTAGRFSQAAEPPTPAQALALVPIQPQVEYTIPAKTEIDQCTVQREGDNNMTSWVVRNQKGEVLRRFSDTNNDNIVDLWRYYLNGLEVYRDVDSNYNGKADQYRWFNTAGTRWAIDKNEDGHIDYWNVISPHEVAEQVVLAIKNRDPARFETVLLTPSELVGLGFGKARADSISESIKNAPAAFSKLVSEQKAVTAQTRYVDFGSARPATIPAGSGGSTKDVTICDNATALVQTGDKHEQLFLGTLVSVGNTWKLIDVPNTGNEGTPLASGFLGPSTSATPGGATGDNAPSDKMQKLMADLERLDKEAEVAAPDQYAANIEQRATVLQSLAEATPEKDRDQWYRQLADMLGVAIQSGNYPQGADRLAQLQKTLTDAKAGDDLIAHAAFQLMWAQYVVGQHDPKADQSKLQEKWLADLDLFVGKYPKTADTAEALFQLGMYQEFMSKSDEAAKWYQQLVTNFPNSGPVEKANGALRRLGSLGKPFALRGSDGQGGTLDIAKYRGKVVLIQYWATMGERWKDDMVLLQNFYSKKGGNSGNFEIIGVCLDDNPVAAKQYVAENKLPWKQIYERGGLDSRLANEMGVLTLPTMILVDQKGNVANQSVHVAELDAELAKLTKPASDTTNALRGSTTPR